MILAVFLAAPADVWTEHVEEAPDLLERRGTVYSLRGGPRQPTDQAYDPVAVYAPDEFTEEEFQDLFEVNQAHAPELRLRY